MQFFKSFLIVLVLVFIAISSVQASPRPIRPGDIILRDTDSKTWVDSRSFSDLKTSIEGLSLSKQTILITEDASISSDLSAGTYTGIDLIIKKDVTLTLNGTMSAFTPNMIVEDGGQVSIDANVTLSGMLKSLGDKAGVTPFYSDDTITFSDATLDTGSSPLKLFSPLMTATGNITNQVIYPEWFGAAVNDSTDDTDAIRNAVAAIGDEGEIRLSPGTYMVYPQSAGTGDHIITIAQNNVTIKGAGKEVTKFDCYTESGTDPDTGFEVIGGAVHRGSLFVVNATGGNIENIHFSGFEADGNADYDHDDTDPPNTTTGDGWDSTHRVVSLEADVNYYDITFEDIYAHGWKGEVFYQAGGGSSTVERITFRNNVIKNCTEALTCNEGSIYGNYVQNCTIGMEPVYHKGAQLDLYDNEFVTTYKESVSVRYAGIGTPSDEGNARVYNNISVKPTRMGFLFQDVAYFQAFGNTVIDPSSSSSYPAMKIQNGYTATPRNMDSVILRDNTYVAKTQNAARGLDISLNTGYNASNCVFEDNRSVLSETAEDAGYTFTTPYYINFESTDETNIVVRNNNGLGTTYRNVADKKCMDKQVTSTGHFDLYSFENPVKKTSYVVSCFYRVVNDTTAVRIYAYFHDPEGDDETVDIVPASDHAVGVYTADPITFVADADFQVTIRAQSGTANNLYVTSELFEF